MDNPPYTYKEVMLGGVRYGRYFSAQELASLPLVDPVFFVAAYRAGEDNFGYSSEQFEAYCANARQLSFNTLLRRYFKATKRELSSITQLALTRYTFFETKPGFTDKYLHQNPNQILIAVYKDLIASQATLSTGTTVNNLALRSFRYEEYRKLGWQYAVINELKKQIEQLAPDVKTFLLHGSFASKDFLPAWSDLDTVVILGGRVFDDETALERLRVELLKLSLLLKKIDPLSHHGFHIFTEAELDYYPTALLPPVIFKDSLLLAGSSLSIKPRFSRAEVIANIFDFANHFRAQVVTGSLSKNDYEWKNDISRVLLLPALLLQASGETISKKASFERARSAFPSLDLSAVSLATSLMKKWQTRNLLRFYPNIFFTLLPYQLNRKIIQLSGRFNKNNISQDQTKDYTRKFATLFDSALDLILKNNEKIS